MDSLIARIDRIQASVAGAIAFAPTSTTIACLSREMVAGMLARYRIQERAVAHLPDAIQRIDIPTSAATQAARDARVDREGGGEDAARALYYEYVKTLIGSLGLDHPAYEVQRIDKVASALTTDADHPFVPTQIRGTSDLAIFRGVFDRFDEVRLIVQVDVNAAPNRTTPTPRQTAQAFGQLFASNTKARATPVVVLLTDVNNFWVFHWFALEPRANEEEEEEDQDEDEDDDAIYQRVYCVCSLTKEDGVVAFEKLLRATEPQMQQAFVSTTQLLLADPSWM